MFGKEETQMRYLFWVVREHAECSPRAAALGKKQAKTNTHWPGKLFSNKCRQSYGRMNIVKTTRNKQGLILIIEPYR